MKFEFDQFLFLHYNGGFNQMIAKTVSASTKFCGDIIVKDQIASKHGFNQTWVTRGNLFVESLNSWWHMSKNRIANSLLNVWCQECSWTNDDLLSNASRQTYFSKIGIKLQRFFFQKNACWDAGNSSTFLSVPRKQFIIWYKNIKHLNEYQKEVGH